MATEEKIFHAPCAFNPKGVSEAVCIRTTAIISRNAGCCSIACTSKARACKMCVLGGSEPRRVKDFRSGLCEYHIAHSDKPVTTTPARERLPIRPALVSPPTSTVVTLVPALKREVPLPATPKTPAPQPLRVVVAEEVPAVQIEKAAPVLKDASAPVEEGADILRRVRIAMSTAVLVDLNPSKVRPMPGQPRTYFSKERIEALAESIRSVGQVTPGLVREITSDTNGCTHEILDGERRQRACILATNRFRAMQVQIDDAAAPYVASVIANFNREDHTPMEISDAVKRLKDGLRMTYEEIAKAIGLHPVQISRLYGLQRLVPEVRDLLDPHLNKYKKLPLSAAIELSLLSPEVQARHAKRLLAGEISLTELKQHARHSSDRVAKPVARPDLFHQWRRIQNRADAIVKKTSDLISVVRITPAPKNIGSQHPQVLTREALRKAKRELDEVLGLMEGQ